MNFSPLSDEQLLDLLKSTMQECISRNITDPAREVLLSEKEKADIRQAAKQKVQADFAKSEKERIEREATEAENARLRGESQKEEAEKIRKNWLAKKSQAEAVVACDTYLAGRNVWINVWASGSEKRVYLNDGEPFGKKTKEIAVLYVTGNAKQAPGAFSCSSSYISPENENALKATLLSIGNGWNTTKFSTLEAIAYEPAN
ncbi:MAG TPA: hypothetical protein VGM31_14145 [Puia sp.]|jgi:hypothetical protein